MKVRHSPRATAIRIADYLLERSPTGARSVESGLKKTIELVSSFPRAGRIMDRRPSVRVIPVARYPHLIFYTISDDEIVILHTALVNR